MGLARVVRAFNNYSGCANVVKVWICGLSFFSVAWELGCGIRYSRRYEPIGFDSDRDSCVPDII